MIHTLELRPWQILANFFDDGPKANYVLQTMLLMFSGMSKGLRVSEGCTMYQVSLGTLRLGLGLLGLHETEFPRRNTGNRVASCHARMGASARSGCLVEGDRKSGRSPVPFFLLILVNFLFFPSWLGELSLFPGVGDV